jgi:hypothetical protein
MYLYNGNLINLIEQYMIVLRPGKGECADPVNEDAILEKEGGGGSPIAGIGSVS